MTTRVAPWLEGLGQAWDVPQKPTASKNISSASHDANSLQSSKSRIPRPSLSSHPSASSRPSTTSRNTTQRSRNPLAPISSNEEYGFSRHNTINKIPGARSVSEASNGSLLDCGTVAKRSKSSSPSKRQQTLEWKRRLVNGQVGYGDQTDLFGPSGLENIFARSKGAENEAPKAKSRMAWLQKSDAPMPSSPPPLPSCFVDESDICEDEKLDAVEEEEGDSQQQPEANGSFRSNPFDLESSLRDAEHLQYKGSSRPAVRSSPDKAFIEQTQDENAQNRTISGQTELEQEDFSPVFVSKHKTVSGQINYAALDSHVVKQFHSQKIDLRHPSQRYADGSAFNSNEQPSDHEESQDPACDLPSDPVPAAADLSFSENLPTGSPFPNLGANVQLARGGYSQQGSFKHRPLSPSPSNMEESAIPEMTGLLSPLPSGQHCPSAPTPPRAPSTPVQADEPKSRSSGSPLKLFGAHDTYTSNQLLRRMSQLNPDGTLRHGIAAALRNDDDSRSISNTSSFGRGELDDHIFNAEITITSASDSDKDDSDRSPASEIPVPGSKDPLAFRFVDTMEVHDTFKMKQKLSKQSAASASRGSTLGSQTKPAATASQRHRGAPEHQLREDSIAKSYRQLGEGKRPPTSPFKNPTPKRRRTLHASELENGIANINDSYHTQLQEAVSSRKRKDALPGENQNRADPEILSQRKILRPRNPTPSQRRRQQIEAEIREAAEEFAEQEPERLEAVMEQLESSMASDEGEDLEQQAQTLASEIAAFTLKVDKPSGEQVERKRSVTTQDFLNEAMMVMNLIRAKARPQSNLGSVEESDAEALRESQRRYSETQEESLLRVSRPPSREGSGWRLRAPVQTDARVINHLRKFEEKEEIDDTNFIANSIASLQVDEEQMNDQVVVVDEEANVRITGPPSRPRKQEADSGSDPTSHGSQSSDANTQNSAGVSTGRTIATSSTRKSDNVGTLAPDAVAHLIGEQVGGMTFDKDKQRWVRVSKSPEKQHGSFLELPSNVTSDDDPFREISDLPVDEQKERRHLSSGENRDDVPQTDGKPTTSHQVAEQPGHAAVESRTSSQETVLPRPKTRDSSHVQPNHSSSVPSRYTAFASSQQHEKTETRATSWSGEELARMSALGRERKQPLLSAAAEAAKVQLAHDDTRTGNISSANTVRHTEHPHHHHKPQNSPLPTVMERARPNRETNEPPKSNQTPYRPPLPPRSIFQEANRQVSLRKQTLTRMIDNDAQEESELSIIAPLPGERVMSFSLSVSRPRSTRLSSRRFNELQSSPSKGSPSHILSDLPDFTIHEEDEERPSERALASRLAQHAADEVNDRYALAVKGLVQILTDVNEDEPYWEDLKQLDLHDRSATSLHGLEDFCAYIQDMDVSNNALQHLTGAPATIRRLNASINQLSSLTSWNHLANLQYLNISNNQLQNLNALGGLFHLRELRADDNQISTIDGILGLDALLKVRLRRNELEHVDFQGCQLQRLVALDLSENKIDSIISLGMLTSLNDLRLDSNSLTQGLPLEEVPELTFLSMRHCKTEYLDVASYPKLAHLSVDDNRLYRIEHISTLQFLTTLSMRRQCLSEKTPLSIFDQPLEASTIYISGNKLPSLHLSHSFLNLRHLELASAGLQELPAEFGLKMPNLRTLNLNFNSVKDIRPLLNIQHLERLSVCGNRLQRLRKSIATFAKLKHLHCLDLRENPLTQGFYPNLASTMSKNTALALRTPSQVNIDEDEQVAQAEKSRYELPSNDSEADKQHRARFDEDAKLRRRVYEVLLGNSCSELVQLDGLSFERAKALRRDSVWDRLVELCIIKKSQDGKVEPLE